jgi:hypothetical protein
MPAVVHHCWRRRRIRRCQQFIIITIAAQLMSDRMGGLGRELLRARNIELGKGALHGLLTAGLPIAAVYLDICTTRRSGIAGAVAVASHKL